MINSTLNSMNKIFQISDAIVKDPEKNSIDIPKISVIIITLNEENALENCINSLRDAARFPTKKRSIPIEIIVSDGGSTDGTIKIAEKVADVIIRTSPSRYLQCNMGASISRSENLLFLHSDTLLSPHSLLRVVHFLNKPSFIGGSFSKEWIWSQNYRASSIMKFAVFFFQGIGNLLSRTFLAYPADNGIFIRKKIFNELDGFNQMWICEGFDLSLRMKKFARKANLTDRRSRRYKNGIARIYTSHACTSTRRFEEFGFFRTFFKWILILLFWRLGMPQEKLRILFKKWN
jgi:glycosyltransferase involved in cell wall biosynthesis